MSPDKPKQLFLSLVIPCYKQQQTIVANVKQLLSVLDEIRYSYEIIVVVDGEVDKSFEVLDAAKLHNTTVFAYKTNRGKSYAIRYGMRQAAGEHVMFLDAGMEIDPDGISMLLEHMKWYDADIIVGSKRHLASYVEYTFQRKILSLGYYYFVKLLFGIGVKDTQAGIKVFKKNVVAKILPRLVEKRFAGDLEMLVVAKQLGFDRIFEAPIKLDYGLGKLSSAATWKQILLIFIDTIAIYYRTYFLYYYNQPHKKTNPPNSVRTKRFKHKKKY